MAERSSNCLFLFPLSLLIVCSSALTGTQVGFSHHAKWKGTADSSTITTVTFSHIERADPSQITAFSADDRDMILFTKSGASVHLFLNASQLENFVSSELSGSSWLKTQTLTFHPHVRFQGIILGFSDEDSSPSSIVSTLESVHGVLRRLGIEHKFRLSVALSLSLSEKLGKEHEEELHKMFRSIKKLITSIIFEASTESEPGCTDKFVHSFIKRALQAGSLISLTNIPLVFRIETPGIHSITEAADFIHDITKSLENQAQVKPGHIAELYADVSHLHKFKRRYVGQNKLGTFRRRLLSHLKHDQHLDTTSPTTTFPMTPVSATPVTTPVFPAPTVVTVPSTTPATVTTPDNPPSVPVTVPPMNPVNNPVPITNPAAATPITVPGAQPVTNPVTTYPSPPTNPVTTNPSPPTNPAPVTVPITTPAPITNPVAPPATTTNAPAVPGQSWCIARSGIPDAVLQAALDYACGIGGADCSQIQQGASCYNPNTLESHASYAFNSYYQKNPVATSCDFGGAANIVNVNPSTGSCTYLTYPLSSSPATVTPAIPTPTTVPTPTPTTASSSSPSPGVPAPVPVSGTGTPPALVNPVSSSPTGFTVEGPPAANTSTSISVRVKPCTSHIILLTTLFASKFLLTR